MKWRDVAPPLDPLLDKLAVEYGFHPLHVEDCRSDLQRAKLERGNAYLFVVLKVVVLREDNEITIADLDLFLGNDYLVTVHQPSVPTALSGLESKIEILRPDEGLYRVMDAVVDSYYPLLEEIEDRVDTLEGEVLLQPQQNVLERVADIRSTLLNLRRILTNTRQVAYLLQRVETPLVKPELLPFLRDVHDHLARDLDTIAGQRDRLAGMLDLFQSGLANQNNQATRLLTVLGTVALPALVISAFGGMNLRYPSWMASRYALDAVSGVIVTVTICLLWILKRRGYFL